MLEGLTEGSGEAENMWLGSYFEEAVHVSICHFPLMNASAKMPYWELLVLI